MAKSNYDKLREYQEMVSKAAKIKNWYQNQETKEWLHLTQNEARQEIRKGVLLRRATVDEELEHDGI